MGDGTELIEWCVNCLRHGSITAGINYQADSELRPVELRVRTRDRELLIHITTSQALSLADNFRWAVDHAIDEKELRSK